MTDGLAGPVRVGPGGGLHDRRATTRAIIEGRPTLPDLVPGLCEHGYDLLSRLFPHAGNAAILPARSPGTPTADIVGRTGPIRRRKRSCSLAVSDACETSDPPAPTRP
jgi:hypothetical protein